MIFLPLRKVGRSLLAQRIATKVHLGHGRHGNRGKLRQMDRGKSPMKSAAFREL